MKKKVINVACTIAVGLCLMGSAPFAQAQCQVDKVTASNADAGDRYGWSVVVNGDYAVVGSDRGNGGGSSPQDDTGAAYLLRRDSLNWVEIQPLLSNSPTAQGEEFGASVAISDNAEVIVVGALKAKGFDGTASAGAVYVFKRYEDSFACREDVDCTDVGLTTCTGDVCEGLTWAIETRLFADDPMAEDGFGFAVDMSGDVIVVGANRTDQGNNDSTGATYVFRRDQDNGAWQLEQKLTASNPSANAFFGGSVSVEGNRIAVGATGALGAIGTAPLGIAYVFEYDGVTWNEDHKLAASDGQNGDAFGQVVDLYGDTIAVAAMSADPGGVSNAGKVYVYRLAEGEYGDEQILTGSDRLELEGDRFGRTASLHGDNLLIGTRDSDDLGSKAGSAYLFRYNGTDWDEIEIFLADDGESGDRFAHAVSLSETYGIMGATRDDDGGLDAGAAYVFAIGLERDCNENLIPDDCDIQSGTLPDDNNNGTPDECECQSDGDCTGGGGCSTAVCNDDRLCEVTIDAGSCLIGVDCFVDGESNPSNECQVCDPSASQDSFTEFNGICTDDDNECTTDMCVLGSCAHVPVQVGTACGDQNTDTDCDKPDECDAAGECSENLERDGTSCTLVDDDENDCTKDQCQAGECVSAGDVGKACGDQNTDTDCDKPDTCDAAGDCQANIQPDETECDDRLFCTGNDGCLAGLCLGDEDAGPCSVPGQTCIEFIAECGCDAEVEDVCKDEDGCTDDFCQFERCVHDPIPFCCEVDEDCTHEGNECEETVCDNGDCTIRGLAEGLPCGDVTTFTECDKPDSCDGSGTCLDNFESPGTACIVAQVGEDTGDPDCDGDNICDDGGMCSANLATDDTPCPNGFRCDGEETCQLGVCEAAASGVCLEACEEDPGGPEGFICKCSTGLSCDDGLACTNDECNTDLSECVFEIADGSCRIDGVCVDEGGENPANECEICNPALSNESWTPKSDESACASDSNICTDDVCLSGVCSNRNNAAACSDGLLCTDGDVCAGGTCAGTPIACDVDQMCDPSTGVCVGCSVDGDCEDDGNVCTNEKCVNQQCTSVDNSASCDDGVPCTVGDKCSAGSCAGTAKDCSSAGDQCNIGVCAAATGSCVGQAVNNGTACDDGLFCTTGEICAGGSCSAGSAVCPTDQSCDETNDRCIECLIGIDCDDSDSCTVDTCPDGTCLYTDLPGCRDEDSDGVDNDIDLCPDTPLGAVANDQGCSCDQLDDDDDDINNCLDDCEGTPSTQRPVDRFGCSCSQLDDDADGVNNCDDLCPFTEDTASVDEDGCSNAERDEDGDGVVDLQDACSGTPPAEAGAVNRQGCSVSQIDSDGDGIADIDDACPDTPADTDVDADGCPLAPAGNDNDNDNTNGNDNGNDNDNGDPGAGQPLPGDGSCGQGGMCGSLGLLNLMFIFAGMVGIRVSYRRRRYRV